MKNTRVIPVLNNKGGVAKTITAVTTASILAEKGYKTLLIDLDQQSNATSAVGVRTTKGLLTNYDVFFEGKTLDEVAHKTGYENLYLIPSSPVFSSAMSKLIVDMLPDKDNILKRAINKSEEGFEFVIIDCPPVLNQIITNALMPATNIVIAASPNLFSTEGIIGILNFIRNYQPYIESYKGYGILITMHEKRRNIVDSIVETLKQNEHLSVYKTLISKSTAIEQATAVSIPINYFDPQCQAAINYCEFVEELLEQCAQA